MKQPETVRDATALLFDRYANVIAATPPDAIEEDPRTSLENLAWMCRTGIAEIDTLPEDKLSRWLGFVQGCMVMRGLIDVEVERDVSRPLFHTAYAASGEDAVSSRERCDQG